MPNNSDKEIPKARFDSAIREVPIEGFRLEETALHHEPSRTLVLTDLVHNVGRPNHPWTRAYASAMGFYGRVGLSRVIRWTGFSDRKAARRSVDRMLDLPIDRVIVGHGSPIVTDARETLRASLEWLR